MTRFICNGPVPGIAPGVWNVWPAPDQHGTARAILSGESVVPVFRPDGTRVATLNRKGAGVELVRADGSHVATFGPRPRVAAVRHALSKKGKDNAN